MKAVIDGYDVPIRRMWKHEGEIINIVVRMNHRTFAIWAPDEMVSYWHDADEEPYKVVLPKEVSI